MLTKLPALPNHLKWSGRSYADVPLRCALSPPPLIGITGAINDPVGSAYPISSSPLRYLISDLLPWSSSSGSFVKWSQTFDLITNSLTGELADVYRLQQDHNPRIVWKPFMAKFMPPQVFFSNQGLPSHWIYIHASGTLLARFVPCYVHWMLSGKNLDTHTQGLSAVSTKRSLLI